ncbi:MAG: hypothetical protein GX790_08115 [Syntrophomonadaceae bacterium]|nr:hypothetical protein [Syntrophomonadaceae bacterium]
MLTYLALSPHPPMIIPAIGKDRLNDVKDTVLALKKMASNLVDSNPDTVVFLTPHGNVFSDCITALGMPNLYGDLSNFGIRDIALNYKNDISLLKEIGLTAVEKDIDFIIVSEELARSRRLNPYLDHGILVPLYYLKEAGLKEDTSIVAISIGGLPIKSLYS